MSKCSVNGCEFYCGENNKCSLHNSSKKYQYIRNILNKYLENNSENIVEKSQSKRFLFLLKSIEKDNSIELRNSLIAFMKGNRKMYILASFAYDILSLLSININSSHHLVHEVCPYVIDVWNLNNEFIWPAVCYYQSPDVEYHKLNKYFDRQVIEEKFDIPSIPPRFKRSINIEIN